MRHGIKKNVIRLGMYEMVSICNDILLYGYVATILILTQKYHEWITGCRASRPNTNQNTNYYCNVHTRFITTRTHKHNILSCHWLLMSSSVTWACVCVRMTFILSVVCICSSFGRASSRVDCVWSLLFFLLSFFFPTMGFCWIDRRPQSLSYPITNDCILHCVFVIFTCLVYAINCYNQFIVEKHRKKVDFFFLPKTWRHKRIKGRTRFWLNIQKV